MLQKRSGFGLFGFYAAVSLVPILVLGVLLARSFRADLDARGLAEGSAIANAVARSAVEPNLTGDPLADGPTVAEEHALGDAFEPLLREGDVIRLRLRDRQGHIVFDPHFPRRGPFGPTDDEVVEAIEGTPVRLLTRLNADASDGAAANGPRAVEVYVPVHMAGGSTRALGALEVYVPYAPIATSIDDAARRATTLLAGGLFVLWGLLGAITWSVTRRLRRSAQANRRLARTDTLTGLANRTAMAEFLRRTLELDGARTVSVAVVDVDGFGQINEILGHENGDRFLQHVAAIGRGAMRDGDLLRAPAGTSSAWCSRAPTGAPPTRSWTASGEACSPRSISAGWP